MFLAVAAECAKAPCNPLQGATQNNGSHKSKTSKTCLEINNDKLFEPPVDKRAIQTSKFQTGF